MSVLLNESLVSLCSGEFLECLVECLVEEFELCIVDSLVINVLKSVELSLESLEFLVYLHACRREVKELRMESECRVRVVWIRILPSVEHCSVVDRKKLENALACRCSPVNHLLEIVELTYSEVILAAEREHRNRCTGTLPVSAAEANLEVSLYNELVLLRKRCEPSVLTVLPSYRSECLLVSDKYLVCEWLSHIESKRPYRELCSVERHHLVPVLERLAAAGESENLVRTEGWSSHLDECICTLRRLLCLLCRSAEDRICESRRVERRVLRTVDPSVIDCKSLRLCTFRKNKRVLLPLGTYSLSVADHLIAVLRCLFESDAGYSAFPEPF